MDAGSIFSSFLAQGLSRQNGSSRLNIGNQDGDGEVSAPNSISNNTEINNENNGNPQDVLSDDDIVISVTLDQDTQDSLDALDRTLTALQRIPEELARREREFNEKYVESLQDRLQILRNLGDLASPREFVAISNQALTIARQSLESDQGSVFTLGPALARPEFLTRALEDIPTAPPLFTAQRNGGDVTIRLNGDVF